MTRREQDEARRRLHAAPFLARIVAEASSGSLTLDLDRWQAAGLVRVYADIDLPDAFTGDVRDLPELVSAVQQVGPVPRCAESRAGRLVGVDPAGLTSGTERPDPLAEGMESPRTAEPEVSRRPPPVVYTPPSRRGLITRLRHEPSRRSRGRQWR